MKTICYLFLVTLFLYSCKSSPENEYEIKYSVINTTDTLTGQVLEIDSLIFAASVSCVDKYLIITNRNAPLLNIYQSSNDSLICQIGTKGHAKNEFSTDPSEFVDRKDENGDILLEVNDMPTLRVVNLTSSIKQKRVIVTEVYRPEDFQITDCYQSVFIDKDHVVHYYRSRFYGNSRDNNYLPSCVTLQSGKTTDTLYTNPFLITECNEGLIGIVNITMFQMKPDHSKFAEIGCTQDYFTITDITTKKTIIVANDNHRDFHEEVKKISNNNNFNDAARDLKIANLDIYASDNYIFLMHDGMTTWERDDYETILGHEIRIYDWEGNFISSFFVKEDLIRFAYNDITNKFYALESKTDRILQYDISKYLKNKK